MIRWRESAAGARSQGVLLMLSVLLAAPAGAALAPAFAGKVTVDTAYVTGAAAATDIAFSGDGRAVITAKNGPVLIRRADGTINVLSYPFGGTLDIGSEKGLLGVVADPDVAVNRAFYFYVSNGPTADKHRVYRAVLTAADTLTVDPIPVVAAARGLGPGLEGPANHDGSGMTIYNGQLYIGVGDTGSNASPPVNKYGSCLNKGNGKVLRVNLDGSIPADNPLVGIASVTACSTPTGAWTTAAPDPRIFAWGFRNPFRLWADPATGLLWIGDVGEVTQEEVSIGGADHHYGYPFVEGNQVWGNVDGKNCTSVTPSRPCFAPAYTYPRSQGQAITGGLIVDGVAWLQALGGSYYLFGDSSASWIRALPVNGGRTGLSAATAVDIATYADGRPVSFRMGPDGSLYVVMIGYSAVYRFTPVGQGGTSGVQTVPTLPLSALSLLLGLLAAGGGWALRKRATVRRQT